MEIVKNDFFPTKDTLQHFCFTPAWRSSTYFISNDFFPLISPNGMNQTREKTQQNAFSETHVFKNIKCHEILSFVIARRQKNVRLHHIPGPAASP